MTQKSPDRDTTIEDIHATRRRIAEKFGHDLAAIFEDAKKRQATSAMKSGDRSLNHRTHPRVPDVMTDACSSTSGSTTSAATSGRAARSRFPG